MSDKRSPNILSVCPLGAGQEVGRSCIILAYKGKKIMLDCGIHPGMVGGASLPFLDSVELGEIDLVLISHFHLDHCGALPWLLQSTEFTGHIFMTHATKAIYRWLLADYVKVSNVAAEDRLYTEQDVLNSMERIETVNFHQEMFVSGIKFTCYHAGHVLGAAMFMIEIDEAKILYTGDFSCEEDRHLVTAEIPPVRPDILITESTYGIQLHEDRDTREDRFRDMVKTIVTRGGRCLIPVFALGRAQELLLILDEFWDEHPELQHIPIYYASSLAKKCMSVYQTFINSMNDKIKQQINISNPFNFKYISNMKGLSHFHDLGPCVILASPGMMQSGLSRELFESWCTDVRNGVIVAGYCVKGTMAKEILSEPETITTMDGNILPLKCSVNYISFSAHTDYIQTSTFVKRLRPSHIILVHGEQNEMARLKASLITEYENDVVYKCRVHNPMNTQVVELEFTGDKILKVVGSLANVKLEHDNKLSGILVKKNFKYNMMVKEDLHTYTGMDVGAIKQKLKVPYNDSFKMLKWHMSLLCCHVNSNEPVMELFDGAVKLHKYSRFIMMEWWGNKTNDMLADIIQSVIIRTITDDNTTDFTIPKLKKETFFGYVVDMVGDMFGIECIQPTQNKLLVNIMVDDVKAHIDIDKMEVESEDGILKKTLQSVLENLKRAVQPIKI